MSEVRKFNIDHDYGIISFEISVDLSKKQSMDMSQYFDARYGDSAKSDILCSSLFWSGSPHADADFEEHLKFFIEITSNRIADLVLEHTTYPETIHDMMNDEEGYYPVFGDSVIISNITTHDNFIVEKLNIKEVK